MERRGVAVPVATSIIVASRIRRSELAADEQRQTQTTNLKSIYPRLSAFIRGQKIAAQKIQGGIRGKSADTFAVAGQLDAARFAAVGSRESNENQADLFTVRAGI